MTRFLFFVLLMGCSMKSTPLTLGPGIKAHAVECAPFKSEVACMSYINELCPNGFAFVTGGGEYRKNQMIIGSNPHYVACRPDGI